MTQQKNARNTDEYLTQIKNMESCKLAANKKVMAHNLFAAQVLVLKICFWDWEVSETKESHIKTKNILSYTKISI